MENNTNWELLVAGIISGGLIVLFLYSLIDDCIRRNKHKY